MVYLYYIKSTALAKQGIKMKKKSNVDLYQTVTNRIIKSLESGVLPWSCPWDKGGFNCLPKNLKTGASYSGINVVLLWSAAAESGYKSPYWLTYKQAAEMGGNVIKGQKGTGLIFYKQIEKLNDEGEKECFPMLKSFTVFNVEQIENVDLPEIKEEKPTENTAFLINEQAEQIFIDTAIETHHIGAEAFYRPSTDTINMPNRELFDNSDSYYATRLHEIVHATSHKSRVNRKLGGTFGSKEYAFEELIAEIGAAFCCAELSIFGNVQHESYIANWLTKLKNDKKYIFQAAAQASKAHQWIFKDHISKEEKTADKKAG